MLNNHCFANPDHNEFSPWPQRIITLRILSFTLGITWCLEINLFLRNTNGRLWFKLSEFDWCFQNLIQILKEYHRPDLIDFRIWFQNKNSDWFSEFWLDPQTEFLKRYWRVGWILLIEADSGSISRNLIGFQNIWFGILKSY